MMDKMSYDEFEKYAQCFNRIPVYEIVSSGILTPVLAYQKLRDKNKFSFLLELAEDLGQIPRYSFISKNPSKLFYNQGNNITVSENGVTTNVQENLFNYLKNEITKYTSPKIDSLPSFTGGLFGYLGYENIRLIEEVITFKDSLDDGTHDSIFGLYDNLVVFDHQLNKIILISNVQINSKDRLDKIFFQGQKNLKQMREEIGYPAKSYSPFKMLEEFEVGSNDVDFVDQVEKAKHNIVEGDIFQIVLSKRFAAYYEGDLFNVYRALKLINPSPYMYFMEFAAYATIIGSSPEELIKVKDGTASILPIAGTRKRGKTSERDLELERELLADPKERAEHVMLVDLVRNDLGRVCEYQTVKVTSDAQIKRYSHVMHIVSRVEGKLAKNKDCVDALQAVFPGGTLTGAPKIRAIQLIDQYEQVRRGIYSGAIGYIDFKANIDMCITIRTLFAVKDNIYWQAGAGIVADSISELELKETKNKAKALRNALLYAEELDADFNHR